MNIISAILEYSITENTYFDIQTLITLKLVNKEISELIDLDGCVYAEYYKVCPDLVYEFEKQKPWMNFYDAIEYSEINIITLLHAITTQKDITTNLYRKNENEKAFEITFRNTFA
jgi:hypothetical protein